MKKGQAIGLIGAGKITDSPLVRMWALRERLGPVKAPSLRVASRISNSLRAGHPVVDYKEFEDCALILISVPDSLLPKIVTELLPQPLTWSNKAVVLCSAVLGTKDLDSLAATGASLGSLCPIPGFEEHWFLIEGDRRVEAQIKQIVDSRSTRLTLIRPSCKPLYITALACTGSMFVPMIMRASDSLQQAGVSVPESEAILQKQVERSMRMHFRAGRKVRRKPPRTPKPDTDINGSIQVRSQYA
jgi:predicted short-subunit dehydrogenase-like oxidoreductase (DUF2520 family)